MSQYIERLTFYGPELLAAVSQTGVMLLSSLLAAVLIGLPLGTLLFLTRPQSPYHHRTSYFLGNLYVNIARSFPFLLLVIALIPLTRMIIGSSFGTAAASFPLMLVAIALYARMSEQVLLDLPETVMALAHSLGATKWQLVTRFLFVEARSGLVLALTTVMIGMVSYSTVMGVVGGGGIGDFAIRYGYQRYETDIMYTTIVIMIVFVMVLQFLGTTLARQLDKRKYKGEL